MIDDFHLFTRKKETPEERVIKIILDRISEEEEKLREERETSELHYGDLKEIIMRVLDPNAMRPYIRREVSLGRITEARVTASEVITQRVKDLAVELVGWENQIPEKDRL